MKRTSRERAAGSVTDQTKAASGTRGAAAREPGATVGVQAGAAAERTGIEGASAKDTEATTGKPEEASAPVRKSTSAFGAPTSFKVFISRPHLDRFRSFLDETGAAGPPSTPAEDSLTKRVVWTHVEATLKG